MNQECSAVLNLVEFQEDVHNHGSISSGRAWIAASDHFCEVDTGRGIVGHDLPQKFDKVRAVSGLLAVGHDFIELVGLDEALNDLVRVTRLLVNVQSHLRVGLADKVAQLVRHSELLLLDPGFDQIHLLLLNHRLGQLDRLNSVELSGLKECVEVDKDGSGLTSLRHGLEPINSILISQQVTRRILRYGCRTNEVLSLHFGVEKRDKLLVRTGELESLGKAEGKCLLVRNVSRVVNSLDQVILLNINRKDLACLVDDDHAVGLLVLSCYKAELISHTRLAQE